tara:strand:- start:403 stop:1020 length:618 start_codon:yes stop_codon:yes gene_type:complete
MSKKFLNSGIHTSSSRDFVKTLYMKWAETYDDEINENQYATPTRIAEILRFNISNTDLRILDYGCGTGLSGAALLQVGFNNLVGADSSKEMLSKAKGKNIYQSLIELNLDTTNPISKGDYPIIIGSGLIGPGAASIELFDTIMSKLDIGGKFVFSLNDAALSIPAYSAKLNNYIRRGKVRLRFKGYGPHLPGINLKAMIYILEKK